MSVDDLRIRLCELWVEYEHSRKTRKELEKCIEELDGIMNYAFSASWNSEEHCYEQ